MCCERGAAYACLVALVVDGCRGASCVELVARKAHPDAARVCGRAFDETGDPKAGLAAARAHHALRHDDDAARLAERLREGPLAADAHQLLGQIHFAAERYDDARRDLDVALRAHRTAGDHASAYEDARLLAYTHWRRSAFRETLALADIARTEATAAGDGALEAKALLFLGSVLQAVGDGPAAQEVYARAARALPATDVSGRAHLLFDRATLLDATGQRSLSASLLDEARGLALQAGNTLLAVAAEVNLARVALGERRVDDAKRHLDAARELRKGAGLVDTSPGIVLIRAALARLQGDFVAAEAALDEMAAGNSSPEISWIIAHQRGQIAEARGAPELARRRYGESIAVIEEMRRTAAPEEVRAAFLEDRWEPYADLFALDLEHDRLGLALDTVTRAQGRMFLDTFTVTAAGHQPAASSPLAGAERRLKALADLGLALSTTPIGRPSTTAATLAALNGRHVLIYFAARERMQLLVASDGQIRAGHVGIPLAALDQLIDDFLARPDDDAAALALGRAVIPLEALPKNRGRLYIVPTGPMMRVPFAAVRVDGGRLIDRYEIVYAPSVTALAAAPAGPSEPWGESIVLADSRRNLSHAAAELRAVVTATRATPRVGENATIAALRAAGNASVLHIIGHSGVTGEGGYLVLADGHVTAADIVSWRLRPRLVVIPTCASAATFRGEMWDSLATAFLASGSQHVVATQRSVEDAVAADFTALFYRYGGIDDPAGAAARAQRALARTHPVAAWSAFVTTGL